MCVGVFDYCHCFLHRRLLGEGVNRTELYVCYHDSVSQDSVEMAYRLLFGWTS